MNDIGLGKIITTEQKRDAVHIAVVPVTAAQVLRPGDSVGLKNEKGSGWVGLVDEDEQIGIVDPFLRFNVYQGQKFWLFLFPGTITSLRHDWTHPAFEEEVADGDR